MSVHKRTWKTAKGEAREAWVADYVDQGGVRRMKTFAHWKEAKAYHARVTVEVEQGLHTPDSVSMTVAKASALWLRTCLDAGLERATVQSYEQNVRVHIVPLLGGVKLSKLNVPTIRTFQDRLRENGRSQAMVKKILGSLGSIVDDAQERGLIVRNVVRDLRASRRKRGNAAERRAKGHLKVGVDIPSPEEIRAFVGALKGRWRPLLLTAVFTGLRRGGVVRLPNLISSGLHPAWISAGVVDADGKAKYTGLHSLRHFYASWCINRRADGGLELPLKTVQSRLCHSTLAMTADTYGHLFPRGDDAQEMANAQRSLLGS